MKYIIQPEDKQELFDLTEILKGNDMSEQLKIAILWYARGRADALIIREDLQITGT